MCKTFLHSGNLGDIVYSLPTIKALGGGELYIKRALYHEAYDQYEAAAGLMHQQDFLTAVHPYSAEYGRYEYDPAIRIDYDLDLARNQMRRGVVHIIKRHLDAFNVQMNGWERPWLTVEGDVKRMPPEYSLIHLTPRWRENSRVNWKTVFTSIAGPVFFIGFEEEHADFCNKVEKVDYIRTKDLLEMALLIKGCSALYCNQSVGLTIAQGIGKKYYLEQKPGKTNCLLYTRNENIL